MSDLIVVLNKEVETLKAKLAEKKKECERLQQWVNDLQKGMYINCVYCGHRYGPNSNVPATMADVLKEHIEQCPKHPMSALKIELATWKKSWELYEAENAALKQRVKELERIGEEHHRKTEESKVEFALEITRLKAEFAEKDKNYRLLLKDFDARRFEGGKEIAKLLKENAALKQRVKELELKIIRG